ncbi:uncharacterized protein LOC106636696 [Copidosoma floridanum]|uniref:uncharacterized protein LOC106636696 n=1 Tax=Copidosoma floridanum TaxID=29053 RepID=UPI0006C9A593|nr:uncharacterized protein LOC106636696 [Copidosoma floridanum]
MTLIFFIILNISFMFAGPMVVQLNGNKYYISSMSPSEIQLNYFVACNFCEKLGLRLVSLQTLEKTRALIELLKNGRGTEYNFWILRESNVFVHQSWMTHEQSLIQTLHYKDNTTREKTKTSFKDLVHISPYYNTNILSIIFNIYLVIIINQRAHNSIKIERLLFT